MGLYRAMAQGIIGVLGVLTARSSQNGQDIYVYFVGYERLLIELTIES